MLDSKDRVGRSASVEHQGLRNEAARLNQVLLAKDQVIGWVAFCLSITCSTQTRTQEGALHCNLRAAAPLRIYKRQVQLWFSAANVFY